MLKVNPQRVCALIAVCVATLGAQEIPSLRLRVADEKPTTDEYDRPFLMPIRCDTSGNVYVRRYMAGGVFRAPIIKLSSDGKRAAVYSLDSVPNAEDSTMSDFAVGLRGSVYAVTAKSDEKRTEVAIVEFSDEGKYESTTKLEASFVPANFAVFSNGNFLVSGMLQVPRKIENPIVAPNLEPFTAIFDRSGRMVKRLELPGDVKLGNQGNTGKEKASGTGAASAAPVSGSEITQGEAAQGDDGNIYLMRRTSSPLIFVISPGGEVVRSFKVTPPAEAAQVWAMKYGAGERLMLQFSVIDATDSKKQNVVFSLVDAETGQRISDYLAPPRTGGTFVCYSPNGLVTLGSTADGHLSFQRLMAY